MKTIDKYKRAIDSLIGDLEFMEPRSLKGMGQGPEIVIGEPVICLPKDYPIILFTEESDE